MGKAKAGPDRHLRRDNTVASIKAVCDTEHMHGTALALGNTIGASGKFSHNDFGINLTGQHMGMVPVTGQDGIAVFQRGLDPGHNGLLTNIKMTESPNQPHAIHLSGLFLKPPHQQHLPVKGGQFIWSGF